LGLGLERNNSSVLVLVFVGQGFLLVGVLPEFLLMGMLVYGGGDLVLAGADML
jgi:hypothetical protein